MSDYGSLFLSRANSISSLRLLDYLWSQAYSVRKGWDQELTGPDLVLLDRLRVAIEIAPTPLQLSPLGGLGLAVLREQIVYGLRR